MLVFAFFALATATPPAPNETVVVQAQPATAAAQKVTCSYEGATGSRLSGRRVCLTAAERERRRERTRNDMYERTRDSIGTPSS